MKKMELLISTVRKFFTFLIGIIAILIIAYIIWWKLPFTINRKADIKLGELVIENIENYRDTTSCLPESDDWELLKQCGVEFDFDVLRPFYFKLNDSTYEIAYIVGFDGPYLKYNSQSNEWSIDNLTLPDKE